MTNHSLANKSHVGMQSRMLHMKPHLGAVLFQFPATVECDKPAKAGEARTNLEALASLSQVGFGCEP